MKDVMGFALLDYLKEGYSEDIKTYSSFDEQDSIPLPYLFREHSEMPFIEQRALQLCKGRILDIGCGAGSHSLFLQHKGIDVTALDLSEGAIEVCQARGVKKTVHASILNFHGTTFDTLLLLMNGIGIVGTLNKLKSYLKHFKSLLNPNGQILLDSSDVIYMFEEDLDNGFWVDGDTDYYGEVTYTMEYKKIKSRVFPWLYVDYNTLASIAEHEGFHCELVSNGEHYDYLSRLTLRS